MMSRHNSRHCPRSSTCKVSTSATLSIVVINRGGRRSLSKFGNTEERPELACHPPFLNERLDLRPRSAAVRKTVNSIGLRLAFWSYRSLSRTRDTRLLTGAARAKCLRVGSGSSTVGVEDRDLSHCRETRPIRVGRCAFAHSQRYP